MTPRKRSLDEITFIGDPPLTPDQFDAWCDGVELFNQEEYWRAHERWEKVWREMTDAPNCDGEIVLRGMIQLAGALYQMGVGKFDGAASNFRKAEQKLALSPATFLGVDIERLRLTVERQLKRIPQTFHFQIHTPRARTPEY